MHRVHCHCIWCIFYGMIKTENMSSKQEDDVEEIRISVRALVEFILRSGDLDNRHGQMAGQRGHADGKQAAPEDPGEHERRLSGRGVLKRNLELRDLFRSD